MEQPTMYTKVCRLEECQATFTTAIKSKFYCTIEHRIKAGYLKHRLKHNGWRMDSYYRAKARKRQEQEMATKDKQRSQNG